MKRSKNFSDAIHLNRVIRSFHNRAVAKHFADVKSDDDLATGRSRIKTALMIRPADSAIDVMNKQLLFQRIGEQGEAIASIPEWWQTRVGSDRPQLAIIFREASKRSKSGNYTTYIPHYDGPRNPSIRGYRKGNFHGIWTLKDNSKVVVNAATEGEAEQFLKSVRSLVASRFRTDDVKISVWKGRPIRESQLEPLRADFYPKGQQSSEPSWRSYF